MRLILNTSDHLNTTISDEQANRLYKVSTHTGLGKKKVTTIIKYNRNGHICAEETMGVIEWPRSFDKGLFRLHGGVIPVDAMLKKRMWSTGLYFLGPDRRTYKWKLYPTCWMKSVDFDVELVRFHRKAVGTQKPAHPYLDVSPNVFLMLDQIILTFVYAEWKRQASTAPPTPARPIVIVQPAPARPTPRVGRRVQHPVVFISPPTPVFHHQHCLPSPVPTCWC